MWGYSFLKYSPKRGVGDVFVCGCFYPKIECPNKCNSYILEVLRLEKSSKLNQYCHPILRI
jgi:hypothetical protein